MAFFYIVSTECDTHLVTDLSPDDLRVAIQEQDIDSPSIMQGLTDHLIQLRSDVGLKNTLITPEQHNDELADLATLAVSLIYTDGALPRPVCFVDDAARQFHNASRLDLSDNVHIFLVLGTHFPDDMTDASMPYVVFNICNGPSEAFSLEDMLEHVEEISVRAIRGLNVNGVSVHRIQ